LTLQSVLEVADIFSLTLDGAHRIFGYSLEEIQEYDLKLNSGRTHTIRARRSIHSDRGRFSLDALLNARHLHDLPGSFRSAHLPVPSDRWRALREEYVEWPTLLSRKFPRLRNWDERIVRFPQGSAVHGLDPSISPGSLMLLDKVAETPDTRRDAKRTGWSRPIYAVRRGAEIFCGHLERDGDQYALLFNSHGSALPFRFRHDELPQLSRVRGIAVPV
jgi:hypothetical protein